jgi:hypothetical protein
LAGGTARANISLDGSSNLVITPSNSLIFGASSSEKMRLSSDGTFRVKGAGSAGTTDAVQFSGSAPANSLVLDSSGNLTLNGGTANGVLFLNGSKVATSGSALTFDGTTNKLGFQNAAANGYAFIQNTGAGTNVDLAFYQGATEAMRLTSTGLGIGASTPLQLLHLSSASSPKIQITFQAVAAAQMGVAADNALTFGLDTSNGSTERARISSDGTFRVKGAGSAGTTDAVQFSGSAPANSLILDSSGNLGIGTSSPSSFVTQGLAVVKNSNASQPICNFKNQSSGGSASTSVVLTSDSGQTLDLSITGTGWGNYGLFKNRSGVIFAYGDSSAFLSVGGQAGVIFGYGANPGVEAMRLDSSGNLLVGTTSASGRITLGNNTGGVNGFVSNQSTAGGYSYLSDAVNNGGTYYHMQFKKEGTPVGSITSTGSSTSYNTSSDYRLKENIQPMQNALAKVAALKPCTFNWIENGSAGQGFIAHELAEVVPDCVTGEKDAVNKDGSINPQGVDASFLVATLTAAIQELKAEFDAYKATHP